MKFQLEPEAAAALETASIVRDLDRTGRPHFLVRVPDLQKAAEAEMGIEINREEDGCVALSILLYDIPTEPVSYDLRLYPDQPEDLRFLWAFLETKQFRVYPCQPGGAGWAVGEPQTFRIPPSVVLRLKHYSLSWPQPEGPPQGTEPPPPQEPEPRPPVARGPDPRDTVIRKLKEQVQALREQIQERDKRIIELEDELHELKSRGRAYKLTGDKKPWWKPFS
ncbi:MAG: hypothetical protein D6708_07850 [Candidatus Dadabacteria bacterium]|nr:MAG: hypothetical protein D6708_07850 [Candidatus Dadabacteria bacterium]